MGERMPSSDAATRKVHQAAMARKTTPNEPSNTSEVVLEFLQATPKHVYSPKEIADALTLVPGRVSAALQYLARKHPEIVNEQRGEWSWNPDHLSTSIVQLKPNHGNHEGVRKMAALPELAPRLFESVTTHRSGATVLRDSNGDLWLAQPIHIEIWPVLGALGFEDTEET